MNKLKHPNKALLIFVMIIIIILVSSCSASNNNFIIQINNDDISYSNDKFLINSIKFEDANNPNDLYFTLRVNNLNQDAQELRLEYLTINGIVINSSFYDYLEANTIEVINVVVSVSDLIAIGENNLTAFTLDFKLNQDDVTIDLKTNVSSENNLIKINDDISYHYSKNNLYLLINNQNNEIKTLSIEGFAVNNLMFSNTINSYLFADKATLYRISLDEFELSFNEINKINTIDFYYTINDKLEAQINF